MHALNEFVRAGVTLVSAGAIVAAPLTPVPEPPPPDLRVVSSEVSLTASSIANIPLNLFYAIANIPANLVQGLNSWADALEAGGSWWLKTPTNVWGWDPANPPMIQAAVNVLVPFPVISGSGGLPDGITPNGMGPQGAGPSEPITAENSILGGKAQPGTLGYLFNVLAAAQLPMHPSCGFECYDVLGALGGYFQVPPSELRAGYTFPEDIINPNDPTGQYPPAWEGQTAEPLNFAEPFVNFVKSLMEDPPTTGAIKPVTLSDIVNVSLRLYESSMIAFSPWFSGSFLFTGFPLYEADILIGGLIKGVIQRLCPICGIAPDAPPGTSVPSTEPAAGSSDAQEPAAVAGTDIAGKRAEKQNRRRFDLRTAASSGGSSAETTNGQKDSSAEEASAIAPASDDRDEGTSDEGVETKTDKTRSHKSDARSTEPEPADVTSYESRSPGEDVGARRTHDRDEFTDRMSDSGETDSAGAGSGSRDHDEDSESGSTTADDGE